VNSYFTLFTPTLPSLYLTPQEEKDCLAKIKALLKEVDLQKITDNCQVEEATRRQGFPGGFAFHPEPRSHRPKAKITKYPIAVNEDEAGLAVTVI
jgi:hypothetical protein